MKLSSPRMACRLGVVLGALAALLLLATGASAETQWLPGGAGKPLSISVSDKGKIQAYPGWVNAGNAGSPTGMFFGTDDPSSYFHIRTAGETSSNMDWQGSSTDEIVPVSNVTNGNWTPMSPAQVVTVVDVKRPSDMATLYQVTQTVQYVAYARSYRVTWDVRNTSSAAQTFIFGTSADLYIGNDDTGVGVYSRDNGKQFVGGTNSAGRVTGGLMEETPWVSWGEGHYNDIIHRLEDYDAFENTIDLNLHDYAVGATFAQTTLNAGETASYAVVWHAEREMPLTASPADAVRELGTGDHEITFRLRDNASSPLVGKSISWTRGGANAHASGTATTDSFGTARINISGAVVGLDEINAYYDANGNGTKDADEPQATARLTWVANNHVDGPPAIPTSINTGSGTVPVRMQPNPRNPEAPAFMISHSEAGAANAQTCTMDDRSGYRLNLPISSTLQPGAATISNVELYVVDPSVHAPLDPGGSMPSPITPDGNNGNVYNFTVACVVDGDMWIRFTLTENGNVETFTVPIGGLYLIDPQGVVYDGEKYDAALAAGASEAAARSQAAISGAVVTLQRKVGDDWRTLLSGDPGITPNINPQTTGADGMFQWDVAAGDYRVQVSAPAPCRDVTSRVVTIPPPVLDLHVRMDCRPPTKPLLTPGKGVLRASATGVVALGTVTCPGMSGNCKVVAPKVVKHKIGKKVYTAKMRVIPASGTIAPDATARVELVLTKPALKVWKKGTLKVAVSMSATNDAGTTSRKATVVVGKQLAAALVSAKPVKIAKSGTFVIGSVACPKAAGTCTVKVPKKVKMRFGKHAVTGTVSAPAKLRPGQKAAVKVVIVKKQLKAVPAGVKNAKPVVLKAVAANEGGNARLQFRITLFR